jgi:hypothetical protein
MSDEETYNIPNAEYRPSVFSQQQSGSYNQSAGQFHQPKETYYNPYSPQSDYNPHAPRNPNSKAVDTTSIIGKGITPSAVAKGVASGQDDALSKYRITGADDNQDVDWIRTLRSASRAQVEDDSGAYISGEPVQVHSAVPQYKATTNAHHQPPPSQQLRRDDNVFSRPNNNSAVNMNRPNNQRNPPPPPGPSRTQQYQNYPPPSSHQQYQNYPPPSSQQQYQNYPPPSSQQQYQNYPPSSHQQQYRAHDPNPWVKEESTIRPSVLRDNSDPLEKYKIKDNPPETLQNTNISSSGGNQPKSLFKDNNDVLDKYRVKSAEEEEKTWHIYLIGLTADPGKPIELKCDGQVVYSGEGVNGHVTAHVTFESKGNGPTSMVLNIKTLNFVLNKSLELTNGRFVRFAVERGQLKFRQQKTDVVD